MQFNLPKTKEEMYQILNDLFYYYRVRREGFEEVNLIDLNLTRLEVEEKTEQELLDMATTLLSAKHEREKIEYQNEIDLKVLELNKKINLLQENATKQIEEITSMYNQSILKVENQAVKAGLINSSIVADKTAVLEEGKNQKIALLTQEKDEKVSSILSEIEKLNLKKTSATDYFNQIHQKEIDAKVIELKDKEEQKKIEVFKYNNSLDEKEQRYSNTIKESKCSLKLRFLDISSGEYTKDQLIDMGYYNDVMRCVAGYYDTLEPIPAYQDMLDEKKLCIYLEDFYETFVDSYRFNAIA